MNNQTSNRQDPFNWPTPQRADLMSLQVIGATKDGTQTRTQHMRPKTRDHSMNLVTSDIDGKSCSNLLGAGSKPKVFIK